jgi:surface antigen/LysM repeat protein
MRTTAETFSNIKTPRLQKTQSAAKAQTNIINPRLKAAYRPRYLAHLGLLAIAGSLVLANSPSHAHELSVRLLSARGGVGSMDATATATVAADIADKSHLIIASDATKAADQLSEEVAITTSDDTTLDKPQVVTTAGVVTRGITNYTVMGGDTISSIASKFNITTGTILLANNLSDGDSIAPGQSLIILPITGLLYTVQAGDTADSLASTYSANAAQILSYNNDETTGLTPGAKIIIPDGVKPQPVAAATPAFVAPAVQNLYTGSAAPLTNYAGGANGYAYGYCTWYVASRRSVPPYWGNAADWYYNAQASGFSVGSVPEVGAIAWTGAGYFGHVAYVVGVGNGTVTISEMNASAGWGRVDTRTTSASSFRYIY